MVMTLAKNKAPSKISPIIEQVRTVDSRARPRLRQLIKPCATEMAKAPATPTAAASVTLARPLYIEPMTDKISKLTGSKSLSDSTFWAQVYTSGSAGCTLGRHQACSMIQPMNMTAMIKPGTTPAMNKSKMDTSASTPYTIMGMDGGIIRPMVPAPAKDPMAMSLS